MHYRGFTMPRSTVPYLALSLVTAVGLGSASAGVLAAQAPRPPVNPDSVASIVRSKLPGLGNAVPGCAVALATADQVLYLGGFGMADLEQLTPITPATSFHVASLSKEFTAFAIAILASEGRVSPADSIGRYIVGLHPRLASLSIAQLLTHSSGLRDQWTLLALAGWRDEDPASQDDILRLVRRQEALNFEPGSEWMYSNTGFTVLAEIVSKVSGLPFPEFMRRRVFEPLGMLATRFPGNHDALVPRRAHGYEPVVPTGWRTSDPPFDNYGASSLQTTVVDMVRWAQNLMAPQVEPTAVGMLRDTTGFRIRPTTTYNYGLVHWTQGGLRGMGHGGNDAGFVADFLIFLDGGLTTITLCNGSTAQPFDANPALAKYVLRDRWHDDPVMPNPAPPPAVPRPVVAAMDPRTLTGVYHSSELDTDWAIVRFGDSLVVRRPRGLTQSLVPDSTGQYRLGEFYRIKFEQSGGRVRGFRLSSGRVRDLRFDRLVVP